MRRFSTPGIMVIVVVLLFAREGREQNIQNAAKQRRLIKRTRLSRQDHASTHRTDSQTKPTARHEPAQHVSRAILARVPREGHTGDIALGHHHDYPTTGISAPLLLVLAAKLDRGLPSLRAVGKMIRSFRCRRTESPHFPDSQRCLGR